MLLPILLIIGVLSASNAARILVTLPAASYSHQIIYAPIYMELAKRGHDIVVLTPNPIKQNVTNIRTIDLSSTYDLMKQISQTFSSNPNPLQLMSILYDLMGESSSYQLGHPEVQSMILNETEHFDLVIAEFLMPSVFAFKDRFNCPLIGVTSFDPTDIAHTAVGNPVNQLLYTNSMLPVKGDMTFFQRLFTVILANVLKIYEEYYFVPFERERIKKYFGYDYPDLDVLWKSVDMMFINVNFIFNPVRPVTPATIKIGGGLHIRPLNPLPMELQKYLDEATDGVVYFSLGSNVKSSQISAEVKQNIIRALCELPYKVLWKYEDDTLTDLPENIKIMKWIPQQDVLRHKNIKVFITQGGLQSLEEALLFHVPVIGIPFFGDQMGNINKVATKGMGLGLNPNGLTSTQLKAAILEVINNPKYKNRIIELATLLQDEPMTPLEKAVWWTEYVLRHKGAQHLKGPGADLPFYQYYYLDILGFIGVVLLTVLLVVTYLVKSMYKLCCASKRKIKSD